MITRRNFCKLVSVGGIGASILHANPEKIMAQAQEKRKPPTNIADALKHERKPSSMPGLFPGKVVQVNRDKCSVNKKFDYPSIQEMVKSSMLNLTGSKNIGDAWRMFVTPQDRIGLKINPVAGALLLFTEKWGDPYYKEQK